MTRAFAFKFDSSFMGWRRARRGAAKVLALSALAGCGGALPPDDSALAEEDRRSSTAGTAPIDYGDGPGLVRGADDRRHGLAARLPGAIPPGGPEAHLKGQFGAPFNWPVIPLHMVLLADGRVLSYGSKPDGWQGALLHYSLWDPALGTGDSSMTLLPNTTGTDVFCAGQALLPGSGNVLLVGGDRIVNGQRNYANSDVNLFTPADNLLARQPAAMAFQRWYATMVTSASGEAIVMGGRIDRFYEGNEQYPPTDDTYASTPEIYNPLTGWRTLTGATSDNAYGALAQSWNYPRAWWNPRGTVTILTTVGKVLELDPSGTGTVTQTGAPGTLPQGAYNLPAVMIAPGKLLAVRQGGVAAQVDINSATPLVTPTGSLSADRRFGNATLLPDGRVWANGGSSTGNDLVGAVYDSEVWTPSTGTWSTWAAAAKARLYHSTSMLMPDGTVLTGGGGAPGPVSNLNAEIFYPPYLYQTDGSGLPAVRPVIAAAPTAANWGQKLAVQMAAKAPVSRVTLVRFGAVTHAFGNDQRFQDLSFTQVGKKLNVRMPATANAAPPGFYMLFALDAQGVPSVARVMRVGS
jgi:hypothetical protein